MWKHSHPQLTWNFNLLNKQIRTEIQHRGNRDRKMQGNIGKKILNEQNVGQKT